MTIAHRYPARIKWHCDNCGKEEFWSEGWFSYHSIATLDELGAEDIPALCSTTCILEFDQKIKSGSVTIPHVKINGHHAKTVSERKGY